MVGLQKSVSKWKCLPDALAMQFGEGMPMIPVACCTAVVLFLLLPLPRRNHPSPWPSPTLPLWFTTYLFIQQIWLKHPRCVTSLNYQSTREDDNWKGNMCTARGCIYCGSNFIWGVGDHRRMSPPLQILPDFPQAPWLLHSRVFSKAHIPSAPCTVFLRDASPALVIPAISLRGLQGHGLSQ